MHQKKHLSFSALRTQMTQRFNAIVDGRQVDKVDYSIHDCLMCAFAMMFFQDPSMLAFQRRMEEQTQASNLKTVFAVSSIPHRSTSSRSLIFKVLPITLNTHDIDFLLESER